MNLFCSPRRRSALRLSPYYGTTSALGMGEPRMHILWTILIAIVIVNGLVLGLIALRELNRHTGEQSRNRVLRG